MAACRCIFAPTRQPGCQARCQGVQLPNTSPFANTFDTTDLNLCDTFWWGPKQYGNLSTTNIGSLTAADFRKGRMQHWLQYATNLIGPTLSMQIDPSGQCRIPPMGRSRGMTTSARRMRSFQGTQVEPLFVARVARRNDEFHPCGSQQLRRCCHQRQHLHFKFGSGASHEHFHLRGQPTGLVAQTNALGIRVVSNAYNAYHGYFEL